MKKNLYLVGVDGSEWSDRAADAAVRLAGDTGAEVVFMHVVAWSEYAPYTVQGVVVDPPPMSEQEEAIEHKLLDPLLKKHGESGVKISCECVSGDPREEIHNKAKELHARMIFVGRRGRSRIADLILGSVAEKLAHSAGSMVVLVP